MSVTMRELGKRLGVSAVTVSKALSGKSGVSEEMRARIVDLARELGYVNPNGAPPPRPALDVGILIPDQFFSSDAFYAMFYKQLMQTLTDAGHFGLLELVTEDMQQSLTLPNLLRSRKIDAMILLGQPRTAYLKRLLTQGIPTIALDFCDPDVQMDAVIGDNTLGAARLTDHLIRLGHREIGFVGTAQATSSIMERYLGFVSSMLRAELPIHREWVLPDRTPENLVFDPVLPETLPTAFVCNCDVTARAMARLLRERGLSIPRDISIVGFDDFNNQPGSLSLSTFRANTSAMCQVAVKLLEARRGGASRPFLRTIVGGELVLRDSAAAPHP